MKKLSLILLSLFTAGFVNAQEINSTNINPLNKQDTLVNDPFTYTPKTAEESFYSTKEGLKQYTAHIEIYKMTGEEQVKENEGFITFKEYDPTHFALTKQIVFTSAINENEEKQSASTNDEIDSQFKKTKIEKSALTTGVSIDWKASSTLTKDILLSYKTTYVDLVSMQKNCVAQDRCIDLPSVSRFKQENKWVVPLDKEVTLATFDQLVKNSYGQTHKVTWLLKGTFHEVE